MLDDDEFARWHAAGAETLAAARVQARAGTHNWACFLAEQAAQLSLKGLLHGVGAAPWGHDLVALGESATTSLGDAWRPELDAPLRRLSQYYIATRYPDANPSGKPSAHYGPEDSDLALELATQVIAAVEAIWADLPRQP